MSLTESTMLELGSPAPDFSLIDVVSGDAVTLDAVAGEKGSLVMFLCAHCPFVVHIHAELGRLSADYADKPIGIVAISSNWTGSYPQDGPDGMREQAAAQGFQFPYLFDESQDVAKAYKAACTPDFFLFDGDRKLVYRGQFDSSRPSKETPVSGKDLRAAMESLLAGEPVAETQIPSAGCNIKWKPGGEPEYYG